MAMSDGKPGMIGAKKKEHDGCANCKCRHGKKDPLSEGIAKGGNGSRGTAKLDAEKLQRHALAERPNESRDMMLAAQLAGEGGSAKPVPWTHRPITRREGGPKTLPDEEIRRIKRAVREYRYRTC